jgi:two-component system, chemotaxis family, chemotaxis protein CheY
MWILVVDDDPGARRIVARVLGNFISGRCIEAEDGVQALEIFGGRFGLVVTDWEMPNMDGIELVKAIRAREDGKNVPIIMVTTLSEPEDVAEAVSAGVDGFLEKPFEVEDLRVKVREAVFKLR